MAPQVRPLISPQITTHQSSPSGCPLLVCCDKDATAAARAAPGLGGSSSSITLIAPAPLRPAPDSVPDASFAPPPASPALPLPLPAAPLAALASLVGVRSCLVRRHLLRVVLSEVDFRCK
jgi:hypothetical protein